MEDIHVDKRTVTGKACRTLRNDGITPAVIYGYGKNRESKNIQLTQETLHEVMGRLSSARPVQLELDETLILAIIKDVVMHPVTNDILHVDFMAVNENTPVTVSVPVVLTGISPAVKNNIGVLVHELDQVEVTCLPDYIPDQIDVDITTLKVIGDNVLVEDLKLPENLSLSEKELKRTVVTIAKAQKVIEETTETTPGEESEEESDSTGKESENLSDGESANDEQPKE
ncbi:50S ribosomal protein L25 [Candidatus Dojkabacteria bacterium]|nr:50S ribosomal protein L25 [Candidatus Dojkabacteria bacterium]